MDYLPDHEAVILTQTEHTNYQYPPNEICTFYLENITY